MANEHGSPSGDLKWLERLAADATAFGFHAALRRFDATYADRPRLGDAERPSDEVLRVGQLPSSTFEPCEISAYTPPAGDDAVARLYVAFLGLWGPTGPLPGHLTEYARDRLRHAGDPTLARFVDVFHHRALLLFHKAWARAQPTASMDRPDRDAFALYLGALVGLGLDATRRAGAPDHFGRLHYAGHLAGAARCADGLRDIVADQFGLPTAVEEFVGEWLDLPEDARWHLGASRDTGTLGKTIVLGARAWSRTHKFRLVLGPLDEAQFERMLPGSEDVARLRDVVRLYTNDEWDWDLRLVLSETIARPMRLDGRGRLGWTTRLGSGRGLPFDLLVDPVRRRTRRVHKARVAAHTDQRDI